jgi:hypothetical protein
MPKRRAPEQPNRGARAKKRDATGVALSIDTDSSKPATNRGRATPGKVLRGSVSARSVLGRAILDKLDRGIVLLDSNGALVDANSLARDVLAVTVSRFVAGASRLPISNSMPGWSA